jgi:hypothetical protein
VSLWAKLAPVEVNSASAAAADRKCFAFIAKLLRWPIPLHLNAPLEPSFQRATPLMLRTVVNAAAVVGSA